MEINEYGKRAMSTCLPESENVMYMLLGLNEECGELCGKVSKAIRKGKIEIDGNEIVSNMPSEEYYDWLESVLLEIGDVMWMTSGLCNVLGFTPEYVAGMNISKLAERKKNRTIDGKGDGVTAEERL